MSNTLSFSWKVELILYETELSTVISTYHTFDIPTIILKTILLEDSSYFSSSKENLMENNINNFQNEIFYIQNIFYSASHFINWKSASSS